MRMHINKTGSYNKAGGVNGFGSGGICQLADLYNASVLNGNVCVIPTVAGAVNNFSIADNYIVIRRRRTGLLDTGTAGLVSTSATVAFQ